MGGTVGEDASAAPDSDAEVFADADAVVLGDADDAETSPDAVADALEDAREQADALVLPDTEQPDLLDTNDAGPPPLTPQDDRVLSARVVGNATGPGQALLLVLGGIDQDTLSDLLVSAELLDADRRSLGTVTASAAEIVAYERIAAGASWFYPISGTPRLVLTDASGVQRLQLDGNVDGTMGVFFPDSDVDPQLRIESINATPHEFARQMWTEDGFGRLDRLVVPNLNFSIHAAPAADGSLPAGFAELQAWTITVQERVACGDTEPCDVEFEELTIRGGIYPDALVHVLLPIPFELPLTPVDAEITIIPTGESGLSSQVLMTPVGANDSVFDGARLTSAGVSSVPVRGAEWLETLLAPRAAIRDGEGGARQTYSMAWVARQWSREEVGAPIENAALRLRSNPDEHWQFWPRIPVHSYQKTGTIGLAEELDVQGGRGTIVIGDGEAAAEFEFAAGAELGTCVRALTAAVGYCAMVWNRDERWRLSVVVFGQRGSALPGEVDLSLSFENDDSGELETTLILDTPVAAVFGIGLPFAQSPAGGTFSTTVELEIGDDGERDRVVADGDVEAFVGLAGARHEFVAGRRQAPFSDLAEHLLAAQPIEFVSGGLASAPPALVIRWDEDGAPKSRLVGAELVDQR